MSLCCRHNNIPSTTSASGQQATDIGKKKRKKEEEECPLKSNDRALLLCCRHKHIPFTTSVSGQWQHEPEKFSSVQSLDRLGRSGDELSEILFQTFLREATVSSSGMNRDVSLFDGSHLALFPLPATASPNLQGALYRMVTERLLWRAICTNHTCSRLLTVAERGSCGPTRNLIPAPQRQRTGKAKQKQKQVRYKKGNDHAMSLRCRRKD